ncbi:MAG: hypothetical protein ACWA5R_06705 [bacterium]
MYIVVIALVSGCTHNVNHMSGSGYIPKAGELIKPSAKQPIQHSHNGQVHSHLLPPSGLRHSHNTGSDINYNQGGNQGETSHSHGGRTHSHILPAQGLNHSHSGGSTATGGGNNTNNGNNSNSQSYGYYDYADNQGNNNSSYYDYGSNSDSNNNNNSYYDYSQPRAGSWENTGARDNYSSRELLPVFPWQPPPYSAKENITGRVLRSSDISLRDVKDQIIDALKLASSEYEYGIFSIPEGDGIAIVTRAERIRSDGSFLKSARWGKTGSPANFNFIDYLKDIFLEKPGYYRIIVFTITRNVSIEPSRVFGVLDVNPRYGSQLLSQEIAMKKADGYSINALVYVYENRRREEPVLWDSQSVSAEKHLIDSGIQASLNQLVYR